MKKTTKPAPDYAKGVEYWNNIDASVDGVLGGFGEGVSRISLMYSCGEEKLWDMDGMES